MQRWFNRTLRIALTLGLALMFASAAFAQFTETVLDTNLTGKGRHTDPLLVNGWGIAYAPGGPWWVSDEGRGWSTLYDGSGDPQSLQVVVPSASGSGAGSPTGIVYNGSQQFLVEGWASVFLFATLDGTIQGWSPISNASQSIIAVNNSGSGASYTALAITSHSSGNSLYACNFTTGMVEIYNGSFQLTGTFTDTALPKGYVPFGIQDIGGQLYVAFAQSNGSAGGVIDIYTEAGTLVKHLAHGAPLNQPWGLAMSGSNFGSLSNSLLVSNNTNTGTINAFNPTTGKLVGTVTGTNGKNIVINQIWGIGFGGGNSSDGETNQLFFAAGPANNADGEFGYIQPASGR
jgi:uncharacterized protein (TIGR03118 family)